MFKIDLHVHTLLGGDSNIQPNEIVRRALQVGVDAVCVTEHHSYDTSEPLRKISRKTGFPLFRGMEYRAAEGHLLVFGIKAGRSDFPPGLPMQRVINSVNARNGVAVPAHPYQKGLGGQQLGDRLFELEGLFALEVLNGSASTADNQRARNAADRLGIKGVGGSDAHGIHVLGRAYTRFGTAIKTEEELAEALRSGEFSPCWNDDHYQRAGLPKAIEKS
jgi:predicted metal-dependent phosphoesterase TrpH